MMKRFLFAALLAAVSGGAMAADVGVSITVGQPGFYGRIDLGNAPPPQVIYAAPVVIQTYPVTEVREPLYLRVPPGHEKKWSKHCKRYGACGRPVYFVQSGWYNNVYVPYYKTSGYDKNEKDNKQNKKEKHSNNGNNGEGHGKKHKGGKED
jgi:opacity protein-like surface antigen